MKFLFNQVFANRRCCLSQSHDHGHNLLLEWIKVIYPKLIRLIFIVDIDFELIEESRVLQKNLYDCFSMRFVFILCQLKTSSDKSEPFIYG